MQTVKTLHHVGIAVRSIDSQRIYYEDILGADFEGIEEVAAQEVRVAFFRIGDVRLELLEATAPSSPIAKFLAKRGEGLHHLAFAVDHIEERIAEWKQAGLQMIDETPRSGSHHMNIAFVHPHSTHGVLTELCEPATRQ